MSDYAFPGQPEITNRPGSTSAIETWISAQRGLTKRELFAAMAMQGILADGSPEFRSKPYDLIAEDAVKYADALLAALRWK